MLNQLEPKKEPKTEPDAVPQTDIIKFEPKKEPKPEPKISYVPESLYSFAESKEDQEDETKFFPPYQEYNDVAEAKGNEEIIPIQNMVESKEEEIVREGIDPNIHFMKQELGATINAERDKELNKIQNLFAEGFPMMEIDTDTDFINNIVSKTGAL